MKQTETLVVGASISGLAVAASLQRRGIEYTAIEKASQIAAPWHNHYQRLHLHTNKRISNLPFKKFDKNIPRYPSRQQVIDYLQDYQQAFNIHPIFNTEAKRIKKEKDYWITETTGETFQSKYIVIATGAFSKSNPVYFKGMETFTGKVLHSSEYKTGKDFKGQTVLVVGFGNSACEIAIDLYEQGATPAMSVRSPVNIIPRDILGIPILEVSLLMNRLPPRIADTINAPLMRLLFGDITTLGLKKKQYGPFEEIQKDRTIPVLDIGTIKHIRKGHITIFGGINYIKNNTVYFIDGRQVNADAIIAAIGYDTSCTAIADVDNSRFEDLHVRIDKQQFFGKDGLYFCGFWIGATGHIREIALDAQQIAKHIAKQQNR